MIDALARVYDLQNSDQYRDEMTYVEPETGARISCRWLLPRSARGLAAQARATASCGTMLTWGQLGRSPDILAPYIINRPHLQDAFGAVKHPHCDFGENIVNYYKYCRDNDLFLTHALGDPQVDRSTQPQNEHAPCPRTKRSPCTSSKRRATASSSRGGKQLSTARRAQQRVLRLAVGDLLRAQRPALRARLLDPDQQPRA